jgi:hypothetical protein
VSEPSQLSKFTPPFTTDYGDIKDAKGRVLLSAEAVKENYDLAREIAEELNAPHQKSRWLIETARQTWWDGRKTGLDAFFTPYPNEAIGFARFEDAEVARCWLLEPLMETLRSTEHIFLDGQKSPSEKEGE